MIMHQPFQTGVRCVAVVAVALAGVCWSAAESERGALRAAKPAADPVSDHDREFWSFRKIARPQMPVTKAADQVRTPVDAFLLQRLEAQGLSFSPEADRATLVR